MAETNPLCASEITSSVPCKPRSFRYLICQIKLDNMSLSMQLKNTSNGVR